VCVIGEGWRGGGVHRHCHGNAPSLRWVATMYYICWLLLFASTTLVGVFRNMFVYIEKET